MITILVAVFENDGKALQGLNSLKALRATRNIGLYSSAIISKDYNGNFIFKTALGVSVCAAPSQIIGLILDTDYGNISAEFIDEVNKLINEQSSSSSNCRNRRRDKC